MRYIYEKKEIETRLIGIWPYALKKWWVSNKLSFNEMNVCALYNLLKEYNLNPRNIWYEYQFLEVNVTNFDI